MSKTLMTISLISGLAISSHAIAEKITVISYGGASKDAQQDAFYKPFTAHSGTDIVAGEWNGEMAKLKAMVETKSVSWDVLDVEDTDLARGCEEGLFEKIDYSKIESKDHLIPGSQQECGVGIFMWSNVLAYNADKLKVPPKDWKDFWDVKKFPGKRSLRKSARGSLEFALMADGVPVDDVYKVLSTPAGVARAFAKLDELKPYIQWWEAGAQPPQYLVSGDVVMSSAYSGRIHAVQKTGVNLKTVWNQNLYQFDDWAIPKGTPHLDKAYQFINFAMRPEQQKIYTEQMAYGPSNTIAAGLLDKSLAADLPTAPDNMKNALKINVDFWLEYGESLEERFIAWSSKN
ncbi:MULTISPECIES: ABC transporter substrate-binding protein [unclassified Pseudomonas]|jgi:putative spermidine/putrescine transport system substrate-binding protein|uniref:ABC transporter substrate-binding protein n=1 Tax=unclassified Pseudomonas TaxID=196821 RepID=UPI000C2FAA5A|nr:MULTISPECIES: ABC transporter substrate-binding protein [unclassified Pseudomonas]MCU1739332.1 ABC transporter substrate-binding protein [Pseudomonas sp. 20S_6.2_Bac1]